VSLIRNFIINAVFHIDLSTAVGLGIAGQKYRKKLGEGFTMDDRYPT
jgi:hypothetical protein